MAKVTPPQNIPSELLDLYRAALGEKRPDHGVRKRYPYRVPTMQTLVGHPSPKQKTQRARFLVAENNFADVDWPTRQRWYAAAPIWGSYLWYYNYFIMSSLLGNANPEAGGSGVIKSIQHKLISIPAGAGEGQVAITAVDIAKTVVMISGASVAYGYEEDQPFAVPVYPYVSSIAAELVKAKWSIAAPFGNNTLAAVISILVIEYI